MAEVFDFTTFPTLTTERLVLRELTLDDTNDVFEFRRDFEVQKYNSAPMRDPAEAAALIQRLLDGYAAHRSIQWGVTLRGDGRVLGLFGIVSWEPYHHRANIGYDLNRAYWGQGVASEALNALLQFGFTRMEWNRVEAETIADNHGSVRLLSRFGFVREGLRRAFSFEEDGTYHDGAIYGLLRDEFRQPAG